MSRGLVDKLRARVKDERYKSSAFSITIADQAVTEAILEVTRSHLYVTLRGRPEMVAPNSEVSFAMDGYDTIGGLARYLQTLPGYAVTLAEDCEYDHPSSDLETLPPTLFTGQTPELKTRMFADEQLFKIIDEAARRHNPTYEGGSVPADEEVFVLQLAQAVLMRTLANDAIKRRKLQEVATDLLAIADSYEQAYERDLARHRRVIPTPALTPMQRSTMREGDIVTGQMYRRNLRTGRAAPASAALPPVAPLLLEPAVDDVEDTSVTLHWERNTDDDLCYFELWRDTQPNVVRDPQLLGGWSASRFDYNSAYPCAGGYARQYTSKLVFRTTSAYRERTQYSDHGTGSYDAPQPGEYYGLEPETEYFYRLYAVNNTYEAAGSEVLAVRTKAQRALIEAIAPTVLHRAALAPLTLQVRHPWPSLSVLVEGKKLNNLVIIPSSVTPASLATVTGSLPLFHVPGPKDVVLISPNGLVHVAHRAISLT